MPTKPVRIRFNKYTFRRTFFGKYILQVSWVCQNMEPATRLFVGDQYLECWDADAFEIPKAKRLLNT